MALDRRMAELRARHAREINRLHGEFVKQDPTIDPGVDNVAMTQQQAEAWREFTADEDAKFTKARAKLAAELRAEHARHASRTSPSR